MTEPEAEAQNGAIDTRYGRLRIPGGEDVISRFLARCGEWGWDEAGFIASALPERARVLDVGAYLGTFGLGLSIRKRLGFLCLVEANQKILPLLRQNIQANATCPTAVVSAMVCGPDLSTRPGRGDPNNLGSASFASDAEGDPVADSPEHALALSQIRAQYGHFDLIKLDVEGMERDILHADQDYLSRGEATLWIECNESAKSLLAAELALSWGLASWYFAFPSHNPDNFLAEYEPIFPWAYEAGLLVAPKNEPRMDAELQAHNCILRPIVSVADLREAMWFTPRWLPRELAHAETAQLAAMAGRALLKQSPDDFLSRPSVRSRPIDLDRSEAEEVPADMRDPLARERRRCAALEAGFASAEKVALERLWELNQERKRREIVETELVEAEKLSFARLAQLNEERGRREAAEAGRAQAESLAAEATRARSELLAERAEELADERKRREAAEQMLAGANALALARLAELGAERERADATERKLQEAHAQIAGEDVEKGGRPQFQPGKIGDRAPRTASPPGRLRKTVGSSLRGLMRRLGWTTRPV